jgi:hypothetical protein
MPGIKGAEREDHDECAARVGQPNSKAIGTECTGLHRARLAVFAHDFAELVVDFYCVLRGFIDQLHPAALAFGRAGLRNQIGRLNDGLEGVAEIVRERAEFARNVGGDLFGGSFGAGDSIVG